MGVPLVRAFHRRLPLVRIYSDAIAGSRLVRSRVHALAGMALLACGTNHPAGAQRDESAVARFPLTLAEVLSHRAARPLTETSYWAPFLSSGFTIGSGA